MPTTGVQSAGVVPGPGAGGTGLPSAVSIQARADDLEVGGEAIPGLGDPAALVGDEAGVAAGPLEGAVEVVYVAPGGDAARPALHPGPAGVAHPARAPQGRAQVAPPLIDVDDDDLRTGQARVGAVALEHPDGVARLHHVTDCLRGSGGALLDQRHGVDVREHAAELLCGRPG